jgi:hypothetical protein
MSALTFSFLALAFCAFLAGSFLLPMVLTCAG